MAGEDLHELLRRQAAHLAEHAGHRLGERPSSGPGHVSQDAAAVAAGVLPSRHGHEVRAERRHEPERRASRLWRRIPMAATTPRERDADEQHP